MNIGEWSYKRARLWPDHTFLKQGEQYFTNRDFNERVNRMAHVLLAKGIQKGDRVATVMVNYSAFFEIFFACAKAGAIIVPINHHLAVPELSRIIADCGPRVLIYSPCFGAVVKEVRNCGVQVESCLQHVGDAAAAASGFDDPADMRNAAEPAVPREATLGDPLLIMFTSGTTGILKGAVLSHENFLFGSIQNLLSYGIAANRRIKQHAKAQ